jgi:hypothetical protein
VRQVLGSKEGAAALHEYGARKEQLLGLSSGASDGGGGSSAARRPVDARDAATAMTPEPVGILAGGRSVDPAGPSDSFFDATAGVPASLPEAAAAAASAADYSPGTGRRRFSPYDIYEPFVGSPGSSAAALQLAAPAAAYEPFSPHGPACGSGADESEGDHGLRRRRPSAQRRLPGHLLAGSQEETAAEVEGAAAEAAGADDGPAAEPADAGATPAAESWVSASDYLASKEPAEARAPPHHPVQHFPRRLIDAHGPRVQVPALVQQIREARAESSGSTVGLAASAIFSSPGSWGAGRAADGPGGAAGGGLATGEKRGHRATRAALVGGVLVLACAVWMRVTVASSLGPDGDAGALNQL